jgi:hypothetical protein
VSLTDFKIVKSYSIGSTVVAAVFLTSDYVVLLGSGVTFWSVSNDKQYAISSYSINALSYYMDYQHSSFFTCFSNKIHKYSITDILPNSTNFTNNTNTSNTANNNAINSANATSVNSTTNSQNITNNSSSTSNNASKSVIYNESSSTKYKTADYSYPL